MQKMSKIYYNNFFTILDGVSYLLVKPEGELITAKDVPPNAIIVQKNGNAVCAYFIDAENRFKCETREYTAELLQRHFPLLHTLRPKIINREDNEKLIDEVATICGLSFQSLNRDARESRFINLYEQALKKGYADTLAQIKNKKKESLLTVAITRHCSEAVIEAIIKNSLIPFNQRPLPFYLAIECKSLPAIAVLKKKALNRGKNSFGLTFKNESEAKGFELAVLHGLVDLTKEMAFLYDGNLTDGMRLAIENANRVTTVESAARKKRSPLFHRVAEGGDIDMVALFLTTNCVFVDERDSYGFTPLHGVISACLTTLDMADFLFNKGADIHTIDKFGNTLLHTAVANGYNEGVHWLFANGFEKINVPNSKGSTALKLAINAKKPSLELVKLLLGNRANITSKELDDIKSKIHKKNVESKYSQYSEHFDIVINELQKILDLLASHETQRSYTSMSFPVSSVLQDEETESEDEELEPSQVLGKSKDEDKVVGNKMAISTLISQIPLKEDDVTIQLVSHEKREEKARPEENPTKLRMSFFYISNPESTDQEPEAMKVEEDTVGKKNGETSTEFFAPAATQISKTNIPATSSEDKKQEKIISL